MSIGILSVFLVEIIIKIYAFRLEFFKQKLEVFDAIIVIVSFALDVAFAKMEGIQSGIGLLIMFRLWRVARILNGQCRNSLIIQIVQGEVGCIILAK